MEPGSQEKIELMSARYDRRENIWTGEKLPQEIVEEIEREDELSRIRSESATGK